MSQPGASAPAIVGTCTIDGHKVEIWSAAPGVEVYEYITLGEKQDGCTIWWRGRMSILLHPSILSKPRILRETVRHELIHVFEYLNDVLQMPMEVDENDPRFQNLYKNCTPLAREIGRGMEAVSRTLKITRAVRPYWEAAFGKPKRG